MCQADKYIFDIVGSREAGGLKDRYFSWVCQHAVCWTFGAAIVMTCLSLSDSDCNVLQRRQPMAVEGLDACLVDEDAVRFGQ